MKPVKHDIDIEKSKTPRSRKLSRSSVKTALRKFSRQYINTYDESFPEDLIDYDMILDR